MQKKLGNYSRDWIKTVGISQHHTFIWLWKTIWSCFPHLLHLCLAFHLASWTALESVSWFLFLLQQWSHSCTDAQIQTLSPDPFACVGHIARCILAHGSASWEKICFVLRKLQMQAIPDSCFSSSKTVMGTLERKLAVSTAPFSYAWQQRWISIGVYEPFHNIWLAESILALSPPPLTKLNLLHKVLNQSFFLCWSHQDIHGTFPKLTIIDYPQLMGFTFRVSNGQAYYI